MPIYKKITQHEFDLEAQIDIEDQIDIEEIKGDNIIFNPYFIASVCTVAVFTLLNYIKLSRPTEYSLDAMPDLMCLPGDETLQNILVSIATSSKKLNNPFTNTNTGIGISPLIEINAYATPNNIILIGEKLSKLLTSDELKAIIGHEIGHLYNNHMPYYLKILRCNIVINLLFLITPILLIAHKLIKLIKSSSFGMDSIIKFYLSSVAVVGLILLASNMNDLLDNYLKRTCEFEADKFVADALPELTENLCSALVKMDAINIPQFGGLQSLMYNNNLLEHPTTEDRAIKLGCGTKPTTKIS